LFDEAPDIMLEIKNGKSDLKANMQGFLGYSVQQKRD